MSDVFSALTAAVDHHRNGRFREAEALYTSILAYDRNQPDAWHLMGVLASQSGSGRQAIHLIKRSVALMCLGATQYANLAKAYRVEGCSSEAIYAFRRSLILNPAADTWFGLGNAHRDLGENRNAVAAYEEALRTCPDFVGARINLALTHVALGEVEDALHHYKLLLSISPNDAEYHLNFANIIYHKDVKCSIESYRRALIINDDLAYARRNLILARRKYGEFHACLRESLVLMSIEPSSKENLQLFAEVLSACGRIDDSCLMYSRMSVVDDRDYTPLQKRAALYEEAGHFRGLVDIIIEAARKGRSGAIFWKSAYYIVLNICNDHLTSGRTDRILPCLEAVAFALRDVDVELWHWVLFLKGSFHRIRGESNIARDCFSHAKRSVTFLEHCWLGNDFGERISSVSPSFVRKFEQSIRFPEPVPRDGVAPNCVVLCACDARYFQRFASLLALSVDVASGEPCLVHFHIINPDDKTAEEVLSIRKYMRNTKICFSVQSMFGGLDPDDAVTYYACSRFMIAQRIIDLYQLPMIISDIDGVFFDDPSRFTKGLSECTPISMVYRPGSLDALYNGVGAGLFSVLPNAAAVSLLNQLKNYMLYWYERRIMKWFMDQTILDCLADDIINHVIDIKFRTIKHVGNMFTDDGANFFPLLDQKRVSGFDDKLKRYINDICHRWSEGAASKDDVLKSFKIYFEI